MADKQNTEIIACPDCNAFSLDDGEPICGNNCPDFRKQLMAGQTTVCKEAVRKA